MAHIQEANGLEKCCPTSSATCIAIIGIFTVNMSEPIYFWSVVQNTAIWWSPIVAGFIGAFGVHLLTQSRDREKWILNSKKQEFRELLSALSQAYTSTRSVSPGFAAYPSADTKERDSSIFLKQDDSLRLFSDRLFITTDLPLNSLRESWRKAMEDYSYSKGLTIGSPYSHFSNFDAEYARIKDAIVVAANRSVPKTAMQRLMF